MVVRKREQDACGGVCKERWGPEVELGILESWVCKKERWGPEEESGISETESWVCKERK